MSNNTLSSRLHDVAIPRSTRTLGSEKALTGIQQHHGTWVVDIDLPYPSAHIHAELTQNIHAALAAQGEAMPAEVNITTRILTHKVQPGVSTLAGVKNIIAVASGKGGVGKSTTSANLAVALARMGARVGVLDADLYGPSQPTMLGVAEQQPTQQDKHFIPVCSAGGIQVMSIGFLVDTDQAVVWRGPMVSQALQQLLFQSRWDDVDYLIVDLPPGTGDIQLTLSQKIPVTGAVVVTTPQDIALIDARKAIDMFNKVNIPIFGVMENMSVHVCSQCGHAEPIFGHDGGKALADSLQVPLLGQLPLSLPIREAMDCGAAEALYDQQPAVAAAYTDAAWQLVQAVADKGRDFSSRFPEIVVE